MRPISILLLVLLASCGGSSSPKATFTERRAVAFEAGISVGPAAGSDTHPVGDTPTDISAVYVVSFDIDGIGPVVDATLQLTRVANSGAPEGLAPLVVDHIDAGAAADVGDKTSVALTAAAHTLGGLGPWTLDVTSLVQADQGAGRVRSAFRVQITSTTDGDGMTDAMFFGSAVNPTLTHRPTLEVTYEVP